ncbi:small T antigen, partial [Pipistrellus pipistrellus polyomavirus 1]
MDKFLEKEEKNLLVRLLEVNANSFYNLPIMKSAFRKASKKWHPDKGGNLETMTLLNSLWQKYQEGVVELRNTQVCAAWVTDVWDISCAIFYGPQKFKELVYKTPQCLIKGSTSCKCLCCVLSTQHALLKTELRKQCLFWGECFCLRCFATWFGLPPEWETLDLWAAVMSQMPRALLQLESTAFSKYNS